VKPDSIELLKKTDCVLLWDMCVAKGHRRKRAHILIHDIAWTKIRKICPRSLVLLILVVARFKFRRRWADLSPSKVFYDVKRGVLYIINIYIYMKGHG